MELMSGLEPPTYALPRRCATNCATSAFINFVPDYFIINFYGCKGVFDKLDIIFGMSLYLIIPYCHRYQYFAKYLLLLLLSKGNRGNCAFPYSPLQPLFPCRFLRSSCDFLCRENKLATFARTCFRKSAQGSKGKRINCADLRQNHKTLVITKTYILLSYRCLVTDSKKHGMG